MDEDGIREILLGDHSPIFRDVTWTAWLPQGKSLASCLENSQSSENTVLSPAHRDVGELKDHSPVFEQPGGLCSFALLSLPALRSALLGQ